jgi:hypothetical protein
VLPSVSACLNDEQCWLVLVKDQPRKHVSVAMLRRFPHGLDLQGDLRISFVGHYQCCEAAFCCHGEPQPITANSRHRSNWSAER